MSNAHSQALAPPPAYPSIDSNGVDLNSMSLHGSIPSLSIGNSNSGLSRIGSGSNPYVYDNLIGTLTRKTFKPPVEGSPPQFAGMQISVFGQSDLNKGAVYSGSTWLYDRSDNFGYEGTNGRLECNSSSATGQTLGQCIYTMHDGSVAELTYKHSLFPNSFVSNGPNTADDWAISGDAVITKLTKPDGEVLNYYYARTPTTLSYTGYIHGLLSISSSLGWMARYRGFYNANTDGPIYANVRLINSSIDYCNPESVSCSFSQPWYYLAFNDNQNGFSVPTFENTIFGQFSLDNPNALTKINYPSGRTKSATYYTSLSANGCYYSEDNPDYCTQALHRHSRIKSLTYGGRTWNYDHNGNQENAQSTILNPDGTQITVYRSWDMKGIEPSGFQMLVDPLQRTFYNNTDTSNGRVRGQLFPEGDRINVAYDMRGNLTEVRSKVKPGSNLSDSVMTAGYDSVCANPKTCNKPNWVRDAKGNQTDYTYDAAHGGVLTVTSPPDQNGFRAKTRNFYSQFYPKVKDANGNLVNSLPVWRLVRTETCPATQAQCDQPGDSVTEYQYATNNLLQTAQVVRNGSNTISATTTFVYDVYGNVTSVDGPRTDVDDRSYTTWDVLRRKVFEIGPDPDGGGPLKRQIVKHYYDADSLEIRTEVGSGNNTDGSDFVWSSAKRMTYDGAAQLVKTEVVVP